MKDKTNQQRKTRDLQLAALLTSLTVITFLVVYWVLQIEDVLEMLALAYG